MHTRMSLSRDPPARRRSPDDTGGQSRVRPCTKPRRPRHSRKSIWRTLASTTSGEILAGSWGHEPRPCTEKASRSFESTGSTGYETTRSVPAGSSPIEGPPGTPCRRIRDHTHRVSLLLLQPFRAVGMIQGRLTEDGSLAESCGPRHAPRRVTSEFVRSGQSNPSSWTVLGQGLGRHLRCNGELSCAEFRAHDSVLTHEANGSSRTLRSIRRSCTDMPRYEGSMPSTPHSGVSTRLPTRC